MRLPYQLHLSLRRRLQHQRFQRQVLRRPWKPNHPWLRRRDLPYSRRCLKYLQSPWFRPCCRLHRCRHCS
jgi:hypothetical protein